VEDTVDHRLTATLADLAVAAVLGQELHTLEQQEPLDRVLLAVTVQLLTVQEVAAEALELLV
jgi:hypothetical protein